MGEVSTPEDLFEGALGVYTSGKIEPVVIDFEADAAPFVRERRWHPSQRVTQLETVRIRVSLDVANTPELHSWILAYGPSARIVAPEALAEKVALRAMETARIYQKKVG